MLSHRFILGTLFVAALVGLCWLDWSVGWPGIVLLPLAILLTIVASSELLAMFRHRGHDPTAWAIYVGTLLTVLAAGAPGIARSTFVTEASGRLGWLAIGLALSLLIAAIAEMRRFTGPGSATTNLALSALAILYVGGLMGFLIQLRILGGGGAGGGGGMGGGTGGGTMGVGGHHGRTGMAALISMIAIVKMSDIGQYAAGRLFGKHKLAPTISPGKTWEGVAGGLLFAVLAAFIVAHFAGGELIAELNARSIVALTAYAIAIAVAGLIGDLAESLLKRDAGVKDSSTWMPGFGGVLDLLDSLLGAAPIAYLFWAMHWIGS